MEELAAASVLTATPESEPSHQDVCQGAVLMNSVPF